MSTATSTTPVNSCDSPRMTGTCTPKITGPSPSTLVASRPMERTTAPSTAPLTLYMPPKTSIARMRNVRLAKMSPGVMVPRKWAYSTPPRPARGALATQAQNLERATCTPTVSAARSSSRVACTRKPTREARNSRATTMAAMAPTQATMSVVDWGMA